MYLQITSQKINTLLASYKIIIASLVLCYKYVFCDYFTRNVLPKLRKVFFIAICDWGREFKSHVLWLVFVICADNFFHRVL